MSKRQARKLIAREKPGCTVKEFLLMCNDLGFWFDMVLDNEEIKDMFYALTRKDVKR